MRRLVLALGLGAALNAVMRARGAPSPPPSGGGWRPLEGPDFQ